MVCCEIVASTYLGRIPYLGIDNVADVGYIRDMAQAMKGGEIGLNGEFYKGGQFVAGSETTIKGMQNGAKAAASRKARKLEIERGVYEVAPEGMMPIYAFVGAYLSLSADGAMTVNAKACDWAKAQNGGCDISGKMEDAAGAWNRGERWIVRS